MIDFIVRGNPQALKRHRTGVIYRKDKSTGKAVPVTTKTGRVLTHNFDPSKADKDDFIAKCKEHLPDELLTGPLYLEVLAFFPRPKNHYIASNESRGIKDSAPMFKESKPDLDNVEKFIADTFESEFFKNDSQIAVKFSLKKYSNNYPFIRIRLMTVAEWMGETENRVEQNKQRALAL